MLVAGRNEDEKQWKPIVKGKAVDWSMKRNESVHALLLALVGGYVLYLAYVILVSVPAYLGIRLRKEA